MNTSHRRRVLVTSHRPCESDANKIPDVASLTWNKIEKQNETQYYKNNTNCNNDDCDDNNNYNKHNNNINNNIDNKVNKPEDENKYKNKT